MKGYSIFLKLIVSISLGMTISSLVGAISRIQINEAKSRSYDTFQEHRELLRRGVTVHTLAES
jgi:CHASE3 domain sensor protein